MSEYLFSLVLMHRDIKWSGNVMLTVVGTSKSQGQAVAQEVRLGFNARPFHVALIVDKVALTYIFLQVLQFFLVIIIPPIPHTHSFIHQHYIILIRSDSVIKQTHFKSQKCLGESRIMKARCITGT